MRRQIRMDKNTRVRVRLPAYHGLQLKILEPARLPLRGHHEQMRAFLGRVRSNRSVHYRPGIGVEVRLPTLQILPVEQFAPSLRGLQPAQPRQRQHHQNSAHRKRIRYTGHLCLICGS